ncbi:hypothetical protein EV175_004476 [Coemansia sp. RSA 1933]|nr:hypothetical protein EV175_004476 [Coemansia sp. RSA 1933]
MKTRAVLLVVALLATVLCMCRTAGAETPKIKDKMLRVPKANKHVEKRADSSSSSSSSPTASSNESSTPAVTGSSSVSEEGSLEADQPDDNSDSTDENNTNQSNAEVVTDAQGNPIVTDLSVSYWEMITPSGVHYLSGASRYGADTAAGGVVLAVAAAAAAAVI